MKTPSTICALAIFTGFVIWGGRLSGQGGVEKIVPSNSESMALAVKVKNVKNFKILIEEDFTYKYGYRSPRSISLGQATYEYRTTSDYCKDTKGAEALLNSIFKESSEKPNPEPSWSSDNLLLAAYDDGDNFLFIINIFQDRNYCGIEFEWGNTPVAGLPYLIPLDRSKNDCSWLILVPIEDFNKLKSFF